MNELEKRARKHRKKQKYPMSIFPDYKKGAEEFNKNSTPINQDVLSSADASSGMAEGIRRNKKKGINEEMNSDFLYWEIAEPQCTGYDCDDNIEYVYGDNEDRVWIEQAGRKYKVFVNEWDVKPTATFTSLSKAKAFGEKYWQDNYGYVNESMSEEYIPDITQRYPEGFDGESPYRYEDDEYRAWDDYSRWYSEEEKRYEELKKNAKYKLIREWKDGTTEDEYFLTKQDALKEADRILDIVNRTRKFKDDNPLTYLSLENIKTGWKKGVSIEDVLNYYNGTEQTNESFNERFTNGTLADFNPQDLMDKVKSRLEAINTIRTNGNNLYMISIHSHEWFARLSPETEYDIYIVEEDADGNQRYVSTYDEFSQLLDTEVVDKLNEWKNSVLNISESISKRGNKNANNRRYI